MITQDAFTIGKMVIKSVLSKMNFLSKSQSKFIVRILLHFLSMRGRHNFLQMAREGSLNEKSYRNQFEKQFNWLSFNLELVKEYSSGDLILGFDPSYICKSGKHMGLEHSQARSENKLNFHFNASITAVSVAKVIARNSENKTTRTSVSIADVKTECQNRNLINRIFSIYHIDRKLIKIVSGYRKLLNFGKIAA